MYIKDFDKWNNLKKNINQENKIFNIHKGDIIGFEIESQKGSHLFSLYWNNFRIMI